MSTTIKQRYNAHKSDAKRRGIEFHFSFKEWCSWWRSNLGPAWKIKRGSRNGQYVMARHGDTGPYHPDNVKCILVEENHDEQPRRNGEAHHSSRFNAKQVIEIFYSKDTIASLARKYNVLERSISNIRNRRSYKDITGSLP